MTVARRIWFLIDEARMDDVFAEMIQKSSNIGAAKTGMLLGESRLYRYLQAFGFGQRTDVDLPGEVSGLLKSPREWGRRSLASISMGQEVGVTPLQMVTAVRRHRQ